MEHRRSGILEPVYYGPRAQRQHYLKILLVAFHGCAVSPARLLSLALKVGHWRGQDRSAFSHTVYSRPVRCFQNSRCTTSSNCAHGSPVMPPGVHTLSPCGCGIHRAPVRDGNVQNKLKEKRDVRSAFLSFSAGTAGIVSGGCNATPPPRRHGDPCERCVLYRPFLISALSQPCVCK